MLSPADESSSINATKNHDKCGADFSEQEYQDLNVINPIDRKTVRKKDMNFRNQSQSFSRLMFSVSRTFVCVSVPS